MTEAQSSASKNSPHPALVAMDAEYAIWQITEHGSLRPNECSPAFHGLLALPDETWEWDALEAAMEPAAFAALHQAAHGVAAGEPAEVSLSLLLQQGTRHLDIRIKRTDPHFLVLWARDVTRARRDLQRLTQENGRIKRDLKGMGNLLNALPIPIWMRNPELSLKYCNLAYMQVAEMAPEQAEAEAGPLELYRQAPLLAQQAWTDGAPRTERRHFVYGGERHFYQFNEIPAEDRSFSAGYAVDYSELEKLQEELQRHIGAQADLLESSASAMAIFGPEKRLKFYNNAYVKLWKLDEAWLGTQPSYREILEVLRENRSLPEQVNFATYKQEHAQLFTDLLEPHQEFYYLPDGRTLRMLAIPHAMGGLLFVYEDVTDRLALERSYNTLIAVQRATLDNLHEAVAVLGENGRLQLSNPSYLRLWGLDAEMVRDAPHISDILERTKHLYLFDEWREFKPHLLGRFQSRNILTERVERRDGKLLNLLIVPLPDGATLLTYLDVTDSALLERSLRDKNETLEEADRLKTEFLANVSYELRSPLTTISGFAQMLGQDYFGPLNTKQHEYVESIHDAAVQLSSLINDILDIASIESGASYLDLQPTDVSAMLTRLAAQLQPQAEGQGVGVLIEAEALPPLLLDEPRMRQSLLALASGALKYTERGGSVAIGASARLALQPNGPMHFGRTREEVALWVEERLPPGAAPRAKAEEGQESAFYRFSASGFRKSGVGLGLSMAKSYILLHGGRVELETLSDGATRVLCILPR